MRAKSSFPLIEHRFPSLPEALRCIQFSAEGATLWLPLPDYVPLSEEVLLRFRIGRGRTRELVGRATARHGRYEVQLDRSGSEIVREAIARLEKARRKFTRIACAIPASVELPDGESVGAMVWQVAAGGAGLADLERTLPSGKLVRLCFDDGAAPVPARVVWSVAPGSGGNAGLSFVRDEQSARAIDRLMQRARSAD